MFDHPLLLYFCWRDAEREARRNPDDGGDNGWGGCLIVLGVIFIVCLLKSCFEAGGVGILIGLAVIVGLLQGFFGKK